MNINCKHYKKASDDRDCTQGKLRSECVYSFKVWGVSCEVQEEMTPHQKVVADNKRKAKLSEVYWDIIQDLMDEHDENKVWQEVVEMLFFPCQGCCEPFFIGHDDYECPFCGEDNT